MLVLTGVILIGLMDPKIKLMWDLIHGQQMEYVMYVKNMIEDMIYVLQVLHILVRPVKRISQLKAQQLEA